VPYTDQFVTTPHRCLREHGTATRKSHLRCVAGLGVNQRPSPARFVQTGLLTLCLEQIRHRAMSRFGHCCPAHATSPPCVPASSWPLETSGVRKLEVRVLHREKRSGDDDYDVRTIVSAWSSIGG